MPQRILLVGDDEPTRKIFAKLLARHGYKVAEAGNGRAAMDQIQHTPAELVLTDVTMPEMDGMEIICVTPPHLSGNKDHCHFGKRPGPGGEFFEYCAVTGGAENPGETPGCSATLISAVQEVPG